MKKSLNKAKILQIIWTSVVIVVCAVAAGFYGPKTAEAITVPYSIKMAQSTLFIAEIPQELAKNDPIVENPTPDQVREEIIRQAGIYGVNAHDALRIARCESSFRYNASNSTSSAKGVYQFINGTWKWIGASGHQYDYKENITQFMKWYPRYPQWWECK